MINYCIVIRSSIVSVLLSIFVVMKLTQSIDWSWWWVTSPVWLPIAICAVIGVGCLFMLLLTTAAIAKSDGDK